MKYFTSDNIGGLYMAGKWASQNRDEKIGMFSSGTASFISSNVINLDGKVNPETLLQRKNGKLIDWILDGNISVLAAWPWEVNYYLKGIPLDGTVLKIMNVFPVSFDKTYGFVQLYRVERRKTYAPISTVTR
ncbi:MAG: hypothetical protein ACHQM6_07450 [Candidatus Kapaibacterium sp.]